MEESISYAQKYLEDLLSFFGLNVEVSVTREEDVIELSVPTSHLNGFLIGQHGDTLRAIQYLVSSALRNQEMELVRVNVDIADYKKQRNDRLTEKAEGWARKVRDDKKEMVLQPMNPADRRIVHRAVGELSGITTSSHGVGRDRHIVLTPVDDESDEEDQEVEVNEPDKKAEKPEETPVESSDEKTTEEESPLEDDTEAVDFAKDLE